MEVSIEVRSKEYFSNLNALAQKIATDIEQTQEAYQNLWHTLSTEEQNQVIDESIISPSAVLKYAHLNTPLVRESLYMYSWFTRSQLDLLNHDANQEPIGHAILQNSCQNPPICSVEELKDTQNEHSVDVKRKTTNQEESVKSQIAASHKTSVLKPKTPPPPPPSKMVVLSVETRTNDESDTNTAINDIPKTGFDFLDNW